MSLRNLQAWGLTGLSLLAGAAASVETGDWSWFSRAGAAVVAVGIVLTSRQVFEHNRRLLEYQRKSQTNGPSPYDVHGHDWANENSFRQLIRARSHEEEQWRSEFSGFYMLVGGTSVWGFGDLLGLLFGRTAPRGSVGGRVTHALEQVDIPGSQVTADRVNTMPGQ